MIEENTENLHGFLEHKYLLAVTVLGFSLLFLMQSATSASATALSVEDFAKLPTVSNPKLSPDGNRVALTIVSKGQRVLVVTPLDKNFPNQAIGKIGVGELHIHDYVWANSERLILSVRDTINYRGDKINLTRLLAVDWDGKRPVGFKMTPNQWGWFRQFPSVLHALPNDPEHVLALLDENKDGWAQPHVHKVNVYTGKKSRVQSSQFGVQNWIADNDGNVLIGSKAGTKHSTSVKTYYRKNRSAKWKVLDKSDFFSAKRLIPYKIHDQKSHVLIVDTYENNHNGWAVIDETERELYEYDLEQGKITGEYKNQALEDAKAYIERQFPQKKVIFQSEDLQKEKLIFTVYSDITPKTYYLYADGQLASLGREYPKLDSKPMSATKVFNYNARDGLAIPAFLTLPHGVKFGDQTARKGTPLIVYPHGGPWAKDEWGFDPWVQYFASRGYAVFQPQFRGSTGYGMAHQEAGYGEWGAAIQDDITDGVKFLIKQGVVDKDRICIVGASFGGYAAAMGLVKTPEMFRCGISVNGVLNLPRHIASNRYSLYSAINLEINRSENPKLYSPTHQIEKISAPLLLIASKKDTVVPYTHSNKMYKKMKAKNKTVEYLELKNGEHWRTDEAIELKILSAIDRFLAVNLPVD